MLFSWYHYNWYYQQIIIKYILLSGVIHDVIPVDSKLMKGVRVFLFLLVIHTCSCMISWSLLLFFSFLFILLDFHAATDQSPCFLFYFWSYWETVFLPSMWYVWAPGFVELLFITLRKSLLALIFWELLPWMVVGYFFL